MTGTIKRLPLTLETSLLVLAYLYLPVAVLIFYSFNANRTATVWTSFSIDWYIRIFNNPSIQAATTNSLVVAVCATVMATLIALLAALGGAKRFLGLGALEGAITAPLILPEIVISVATLLFFMSIGVKLGLGTIIVAHTAFCIPFAFLPIKARLADMDRYIHEAAQDLYADRFATFRRVTLPLLWPGILSGATLAFVTSLDDFITSFFVAGPGATTLPVYIFSAIRAGISPEINAISTLMVLASILLVIISFLVGRTGKSNSKQ